MGSLVSGLLQAVANSLLGSAAANSSLEEIYVGAARLSALLGALSRAYVFNMQQEYGAKQFEWDLANDIGSSLINAQQATNDMIVHIVNTVLPESLRYLLEHIKTVHLAPIHQKINGQQAQLDALTRRVEALEDWRQVKVDPQLDALMDFRDNVQDNYFPPVNVFRDWLHYPAKFTEWATAMLVQSIGHYLADNPNKEWRDYYAATMVEAWREQPALTDQFLSDWLAAPQ